MEDMDCVYFYSGGGTYAPVITTKERAEMYVRNGDVIR